MTKGFERKLDAIEMRCREIMMNKEIAKKTQLVLPNETNLEVKWMGQLLGMTVAS